MVKVSMTGKILRKKPSGKICLAKKLENFNWYLVSTGYVEDVVQPIDKLMFVSYTLVALEAILLSGLTLHFRKNLSQPQCELIQGIENFHKGKKIFKMRSKSVTEIEAVGCFIEKRQLSLLQGASLLKSFIKSFYSYL